MHAPRNRARSSALLRVAAWITLGMFLWACTKQEVRPPVELRHYQIDWEHAQAEALELPGVKVRGILLTPTQWPLESSLKRLFHGDFIGVIDALDFRFHPSKIPEGVLEDLYGRGFVPAYLRIENPSDAPVSFLPLGSLVVRDKRGADLPAMDPDQLPMTLTRVDFEKTILVIGSVVLVVLAIVAGREGNSRIDPGFGITGGQVHVEAVFNLPPGGYEDAASRPFGFSQQADRSLLRPGTLGPKEAREGVILFWHKRASVDWGSAHLVAR